MKMVNKAIFFTALLALLVVSGCTSNNPNSATDAADNSEQATFSIPVASIGQEAKWYEYESNGTTIRFFAVKGSDGSVKTAFDACDVCNYSKKGYSQQGNFMVCNNCGNKYPIDGLGTENKRPGGCWPSYLPNEVVGENIVIQKANLEKGSAFFA
ncbi:MAG: hypothetical protein CL943_03785 [Candidatus Diapherotrites archaeon]|uniref:Membrane iron-sulfur containing protein FtrD-like domain-containing protein n=1 Tax=Candidatus Iainarchaeum sp. TaxID=3101447 RepID=A0A2D6M1V5_9ARCH|nr:hypothetical protein [Candidatus Diapherotrites archaeon]|tara:strand:+ start:35 stop:499 length:465 start_codon:yes stop_codon:yes gene_type:complete